MTILDRIESRIERLPWSGCWLWTGAVNHNGYAVFDVGNTQVRVHRFLYEQRYGIIVKPQLDHLCRVRCCVNPDHLEQVTSKENTMRGIGPTSLNAKKTHCPLGHPYDASNTHVRINGYRQCMACRRIAAMQFYWRKKGKVHAQV